MGNNPCASERDKGDLPEIGDALHDEVVAYEEPEDIDRPPKDRTCTDPICLVIFLLFLGGMVLMTSYAEERGDTNKLIAGIDWQGRLCGLSEGVEDKAHLYWCHKGDLTGDTPTSVDTNFPICVDACPNNTSGEVLCPQAPDQDERSEQEGDDYITIVTVTQQTKKVSTYPTEVVGFHYCLPSGVADMKTLSKVRKSIRDSLYVDKASAFFQEFGSLWHPENYPLFIGVAVGALLLSVVYLLLLRSFARIVLYAALGITILLLVLMGAGFLLVGAFPDGCLETDKSGKCTLAVDYDKTYAAPLFEYYDPAVASQMSIAMGAAFVLVALALVVLVCCAHDSIEVALRCLQVSVSAIFAMPTLVIQPVVSAVVKAAVLFTLLYYFVLLVACGKVQQESVTVGGTAVSGLHRSLTYTREETYMLLYFGFGIVWIMEVCNAVQTYVVAHATVVWYYTPKEDGRKGMPCFPVVQGFLSALIFHLGTMAMGAFLIAVVRVVQFVLYLISKQADDQENRVGACLAQICLCCLECFEKCLAGIDKNAYIHTAVHSTDFMVSAMEALEFMTSHLSEVTLLNGATFIAQFAGLVAISGTGASVTWVVLSLESMDRRVQNADMAALVAGALSLAVASVFMILLDDVSDTLLYVYSDNKQNDPRSVALFAPDDLACLVDDHKGRHEAHHEKRQRARC